uniref:Neur_chan_LBD domain-containing protein n=1 Tax=Macrostomum lignano TaxID=282301 RepID=A0A1I8J944_9PLAT
MFTIAVAASEAADDAGGRIGTWTRPLVMNMSEKNLIKALLSEYDKKSRPVIDDDPADGGTPKIDRPKEKGKNAPTIPIQQVTVEFGLRLVQILDLDEMEQVLTTSMIVLYEWTDYHLRWDPKNESGIEVLHIPTKDIWLPDIALYNYADERLEERREVAAKVHSNGTVEWHPMAIYKSACEIRIEYFPFDVQTCDLKFGPWTYDGWRVNITYYHRTMKSAFDLDEMIPSPEWKILNYSAVYNSVVYPCCPEPFVDITFRIYMKRSTLFYSFILILPCFLLSSLTLVLFWLPPETPAKMVLGMNIFVAFFLLMLLLEKQTPAASDSFPRIGQYYCLNMGIITLSTFLCVIIVNFHFRGDNRQEVPFWLKKVSAFDEVSFLSERNNEVNKLSTRCRFAVQRARRLVSSTCRAWLLAIHHGARVLCVNLAKPGPPQQQQQQQQKQKHQKSESSRRKQQRLDEDYPMQAPAAGLRSPSSTNQQQANNAGSPTTSLASTRRGGCPLLTQPLHFQTFNSQDAHHCHQQQHQEASGPSISGFSGMGGGGGYAEDIVKALRYIQRLHDNRERVNKIVQEWRNVGLVLDRLFFLIYFVIIAVSSVGFFSSEDYVDTTILPNTNNSAT